MVQLSPSLTLDVPLPPDRSVGGEEKREDEMRGGSPKENSLGVLSSLQLSLEMSTAYYGYETYIEDGLICLKHKIRNLEKKKLKLKDYKKRLDQGEALNKDQKAAAEKYEEVLHNLEFARELHKTLDELTQNLLKAQKKVVKKEQVAKVEAERKHLAMVLKVQHLLASLQQEHVQKDLLAGHNKAPHIPAPQLRSLSQLSNLLGVKRDARFSLEEQMEQASLVYMDLLEGNDKPVAGSTYKLLKEDLIRLLNYSYFSNIPPPPKKTPEVLQSSTHSTMLKSKPNEVSKEFFSRLYLTDMETPSTQNWKEDFQALREHEPPDSWDVELSDEPLSAQTVHKPWRGAAAFIPKVVPVTSKRRPADYKQRKEKKAKGEQDTKSVVQMDIPVEVFNSLSTIPKDPILRKQHLEDLMTKIHGSFSFMQDSLLDGESSAANGHARLKRRPSGAPSPLVEDGLRSPSDVLPKIMHSTPLPARLLERKVSLTSGDQCLESSDLDLSSKDLPHEPLQLADRKPFSSPPLYRRDSAITGVEEKSSPCTPVTDSGKQSPCNGMRSCTSTPPPEAFSTPPTRRGLASAQLQNIQSVFKVGTALPPNGELQYKSNAAVFSEPRYNTASTQTPPEFAPPDEPQLVYQSDYTVTNGGQSFLSPVQSGGGASRPSQSYYRGSVRGMARGGKGLAQTFRSSGWHRGGSYIPQAHLRDSGPLFYATRETGYQQIYRRAGRHNSSAWSDSSQVSSPDRDGAFTIVDSGHGDSMSVSTLEVPLTPHSHHPTALLPMQLYPLTQPLRVAFTASRTANFAPGNLDQPIVFDQLHSNLGEMYDTHIGRFTCPANGTYVFIFHILKLAINVPLYVNLMRNEEVMVSAYANDGAPDHETASNHAILPLFHGDQVWLRLHRGAIYGSTWKYSTFSGFLLYQE